MSLADTTPGRTAGSRRTFLFLQGLASPFFAHLARHLVRRGHRVRRVNISLGDELFWRGLPAVSFRGTLAGWRKFLSTYLSDEGVTDIVLFGDCRPYHRIAIHLAAHRRVQVHVCEEGYLRPNWVTIESGGVNGNSSLPRDPDVIRALGAGLTPGPERKVPGSFVRRALWDVSYNVANILGRPVYPGYRRHRPNHVLLEYAGWLNRLFRRRRANRHAEREAARAVASPAGFFLLPLQLDSDYQIRVHSPYPDLGVFMDEVFASFARHAPPQVELLVKVHPLDNGLIDRRAQVTALAERHGIAARVTCIDGGYLPTLLEAAQGVVVVNSTVGMTAIEVGRPTIALGTSIYNIEGLAYQGGIDRFWTEPRTPDLELTRAFRNLVIARTQVNGGYFSADAATMAAPGAAERLESSNPLGLGARAGDLRRDPDPSELYAPEPAE